MMAKTLNRWSLLLAWFDFLLQHRPRKTMGKSDAFVRGKQLTQKSSVIQGWSLKITIPHLYTYYMCVNNYLMWLDADKGCRVCR